MQNGQVISAAEVLTCFLLVKQADAHDSGDHFQVDLVEAARQSMVIFLSYLLLCTWPVKLDF